MILVSGTKRSGTSLWMQILAAAGFPVIGEPFPSIWGDSIRAANPNGFFESPLRQGVFYATNPNPETGAFLSPDDTRRHVVKVFVPGLIRTDLAYVERVVATLRHWRSYGPSIRRLYAMEDEYLMGNPPAGQSGDEAVARARKRRTDLPPAIEWFMENFDLVRDVVTRGYPVNLTTYERLLHSPEEVIAPVLEWCGGGDLQEALQVVERRDPSASQDDQDIPPELAEVFDRFHSEIHRNQTLSPATLASLNETWQTLSEQYGELSRERMRLGET